MKETPAQPIALITGGCRGIGYGIAAALAENGFRLALTGIRPEKEARQAVKKLKTEAIYFQQDLADLNNHKPLIDKVYQQLGGLDSLILNAGIAPATRSDLLDMTPESFDRVVAVNLRGSFFLAQAAAREMLSRPAASASVPAPGFRSIIFITSVSAKMVSTMRGEYCISKAGAAMAVQLLAARLAAENLCVYEIRPGIIATDMTKGVEEKYNQAIADGLVPAGRWGKPQDIGKAIVPIAQGLMSFATGSVLTLDGGLSIHRL